MSDSSYVEKCSHAVPAKGGLFHWLMQRVSAFALIPLPFWMVIFVKHLLHSSHERIAAWLAAPVNSVFLVFLTAAAIYHAVLGIQSILDDYVHHERYKSVLMRFVKVSFLLMLLAILAAVWLAGSMD